MFLAVTLSGGALRAGLAPWPGIGAIVLATAALLCNGSRGRFCWQDYWLQVGNRHNSWCDKYRVLAVIMFPGPILGAIIEVVILGLGVAKGIETLQAGRSKTRGAIDDHLIN